MAKDTPQIDSEAGWPSRETGIDPIIGRKGSHQNLANVANKHDDEPLSITATSNTVPHEIGISGPRIGKPDAVNPFGRGFTSSLDSEDEGEGEAGGDETAE
jgi:hypothetical protein